MTFPIDPLEIARLEERRAAVGTAEVSDEAEEIAGGFMTFSGVGSWTNQAMGLGLAGPVSDGELDRLDAFFAERGVEPKLEVCSFADPSLLAGLAERGYVTRGFDHVFARDVPQDDDPAAILPFGWPEGVDIATVDPADEVQVEAFVDASNVGFRPEGDPVPEALARITRRVVAHARCANFLASVAGEPVGGGGMEASGSVASLFGTSVASAHRRRGIQQALIACRLVEARRRGAIVASIGARPGIPTERNARRLGFELCYAKVIVARPGEGLAPSP